jgi:dTDP-4-dehydrorhamnose 3,5-epimerase
MAFTSWNCYGSGRSESNLEARGDVWLTSRVPAMQLIATAIPDLLILEPKVFEDSRGFFYESYNKKIIAEQTGINLEFVQDNHSRSARNVLRGLHYQIQQPQGKLVRVAVGAVFDVAVDIRRSSPTFGKWVGVNLSAENKRALWIPAGFAHGFLVLSDFAECLYKTTEYWAPMLERSIIWNDPDLAIGWPLTSEPILAAKDKAGAHLKEAEVYG